MFVILIITCTIYMWFSRTKVDNPCNGEIFLNTDIPRNVYNRFTLCDIFIDIHNSCYKTRLLFVF